MANFEGKVAFITGVARGQGRSHAIELARAGVNIIGLDLCGGVGSAAYAGSTEADLARTAELIEVAGGRIVAERADVRIYVQVESALRKGLAEFGRLDFVVANAGIFAAGRSWEIPLDAWREMIDINLTGVWHTTRAAIPSLIGLLLNGSSNHLPRILEEPGRSMNGSSLGEAHLRTVPPSTKRTTMRLGCTRASRNVSRQRMPCSVVAATASGVERIRRNPSSTA